MGIIRSAAAYGMFCERVFTMLCGVKFRNEICVAARINLTNLRRSSE
ncbi:hypothetical protein CAMGR0001_0790 [Campylobacter gracilis RM3268]|uniref:Uncharacterized protein n=1 Tax=Campylobacter gracilis RM3268 TaxID=553220 RepID=C8PFZ7_9BACT|nr:hypothetical protein CAMGR0001_0790 [Campylobacter gracilis RM3268]